RRRRRCHAGRGDREGDPQYAALHRGGSPGRTAELAAFRLQIETGGLVGGFWRRIWVLLLLLFAVGVEGQTYPSKPIRVVVPYTPGGPADLLVRGMGQKLAETWGQQIIVENKPGANEIIAAQDIARSPADGYNYLLASDAVVSLNQYLYSKLPYDPAKDFTPVSRVAAASVMVVGRPHFPAGHVGLP